MNREFRQTIPSVKEIKEAVAGGQKTMLFYHIPKSEVINKDLNNLKALINNMSQVGKGVKKSLVITCDGYDDVTDELYEIQEVREFVEHLFTKIPYLLYYVTDMFEGDIWLLCSLADEVTSVSQGQKYTGHELMEKFGFDLEATPKVHAHIKFKGSNGTNKLIDMMKAIIKHGKKNKDARGGKREAIKLGIRFDKPLQSMIECGISVDEAEELLKG